MLSYADSLKNDIFAVACVTIMMPFAHLRYLPVLRCGSLPVEIELGHSSNTLLANRICKLC